MTRREASAWVPPRGVPCVYFVRSGARVKIGYTTTAPQRLAALRTMQPDGLEVLAVIGPACRADETALHRRFRALRSHGEWFDDAPALRAEIARLQREGFPEPAPRPPRPPVVETLVRLPRELRDAVAEVAKRESRTLDQQLRWYIRQGIESDRQPPDAGRR